MTDLLATNKAVTGDVASSAELSKQTRRAHKIMPQLVEEVTELQRWRRTRHPNGDVDFWHRNFGSLPLPFAASTASSVWVWDLAKIAYCKVLTQEPLAQAAGVKRPKWHGQYNLTVDQVFRIADILRGKPALRRLIAHIGEDARLAASNNPPSNSERPSRWPSLKPDSINAKLPANALDLLKSVRIAGIYVGEGRLNGVLHVLYTGEPNDMDRRGVEHMLQAIVIAGPPSRTDSAWHQLARECTNLHVMPNFELSVQDDEAKAAPHRAAVARSTTTCRLSRSRLRSSRESRAWLRRRTRSTSRWRSYAVFWACLLAPQGRQRDTLLRGTEALRRRYCLCGQA